MFHTNIVFMILIWVCLIIRAFVLTAAAAAVVVRWTAVGAEDRQCDRNEHGPHLHGMLMMLFVSDVYSLV